MKLLSLFSGIGAFERALENLGVDYELVNYCEIDKYASKSYSLLHNCSEDKNLWDVTKIDTENLPEDIDLVTYGFPCQDISLAGKQVGLEANGERTRSGLVWDALKILEATQPKVAICENVKNLTSKRFTHEFNAILQTLEQLGYKNYWKVLNATDFGVPHCRKRVFIVSIKKTLHISFNFPTGVPLRRCLLDLLDAKVSDKYYLSEKLYNKISCNITNNLGSNSPQVIGGIGDANFGKQFRQGNRIYNAECVATALTSSPCGNAGGYAPLYATVDQLMELTKGVAQCDRTYDPTGCAKTLGATAGGGGAKTGFYLLPNKRIRKLTPRECFKIMGFKGEDADMLSQEGISNTQLYKQAGNSIVVPVLESIFKELFKVINLEDK